MDTMTQDDLIEIINKMDNEQQKQFYNALRDFGISEEDILTIMTRAFYEKLFSDPELYYAVRAEMADRVYKEITK